MPNTLDWDAITKEFFTSSKVQAFYGRQCRRQLAQELLSMIETGARHGWSEGMVLRHLVAARCRQELDAQDA